jgi:hypothetical protein
LDRRIPNHAGGEEEHGETLAAALCARPRLHFS